MSAPDDMAESDPAAELTEREAAATELAIAGLLWSLPPVRREALLARYREIRFSPGPTLARQDATARRDALFRHLRRTCWPNLSARAAATLIDKELRRYGADGPWRSHRASGLPPASEPDASFYALTAMAEPSDDGEGRMHMPGSRRLAEILGE